MARSANVKKSIRQRSRRRQTLKLRHRRAKSGRSNRSAAKRRPRPGGRVRVVRSRSTRARKPARPLPPAEPFRERVFLGSLERSLRDHRSLWEALAKR